MNYREFTFAYNYDMSTGNNLLGAHSPNCQLATSSPRALDSGVVPAVVDAFEAMVAS